MNQLVVPRLYLVGNVELLLLTRLMETFLDKTILHKRDEQQGNQQRGEQCDRDGARKTSKELSEHAGAGQQQRVKGDGNG